MLVVFGGIYSRSTRSVWGVVDFRNIRVFAKETGVVESLTAVVGGEVFLGQGLAVVGSDRIRYEKAALLSAADRRSVDAERDLFRIEQRIDSEARMLEREWRMEEAELSLLEQEVERNEDLFEKRLIEKGGLVTLQARVAVLRTAIDSRIKSLEAIERERAKVKRLRERWEEEGRQLVELSALEEWERAQVLKSPVRGRVLRIDAREGELVSEGDCLLELVSSGQASVRGFAPLSLDLDLRLGASVFLRAENGGGEVFEGTILSLDPAIESLPDVSNPVLNRSIRGRFFSVACDQASEAVEGERFEIHFEHPDARSAAAIWKRVLAFIAKG